MRAQVAQIFEWRKETDTFLENRVDRLLNPEPELAAGPVLGR